MFMPGRNNPSWTSSKKRASKAFKNADRLFYEKTQSRTQFMTFTAEIRLQITDLPLKLVIWSIGFLRSIHRTPPRNPSSSCYPPCRVGGSHHISLSAISVSFRAKLPDPARSASTVIQPLTRIITAYSDLITGCLQSC